MRAWRYLEDDAVGAARGLAVDEALLAAHGRGRGGPAGGTVRLYTYRPHCALVGRYQSLAAEVDLELCAARGFEVGRRPTGGGAIIMGPDQLGVAIAAPARPEETPRQALHRYAAGVVAGLAALGIDAGFRSKNDLEVAGRKVAGLGLYLDPAGAQLFHASVLVDLDVELMLRVLKIPGAKVSDKAVSRVEQRVTTVSRELSRRVPVSEARRAMAPALAATLGCELVPGELSRHERALVEELVASRYGHPDWMTQRGPGRNARGSALLKTGLGLVRIYVGGQASSVKSVLVAGDFNFLPPAIPRLEAALKWCRAERGRIEEIVRSALEPPEPGLDPQAFAAAVWEAVGKARALETAAHPRRGEGSCYFPDPAEPRAASTREAPS